MDNNNDKPFEWTDDLVKEYSANLVLTTLKIIDKLQTGTDEYINHQSLDKFKESKSKEKVVEQPIEGEEIIFLPKGFMNTCITTNNYFIADTNNSAFYERIKFPLPEGKWVIKSANEYSATNQVVIKKVLNPTPPYNSIEEKECDYEILSFKNSSGNIFTLEVGGYYSYEKDNNAATWRTLEHTLQYATDCTIHSVLRKSDSKIIVLNNTLVKDPLTKHEWTASEITIKDTRCFINGVNITTLEFIEPKKEPQLDTKPLFTEQDMRDCFEASRVTFYNTQHPVRPAQQFSNFESYLQYLKSTPTKQ